MIFGINKWILKFVSLDLVDIKFLNNNRWRIWFWRNQHFSDRGGGVGYWAITEILEYITRVVCFMCSVTCTCSEALVGAQLQLHFLHIPRHSNILGYLYCVGLEEHLFFCYLYQKYLSNGYRAIDVMQPRRGSMGERIYWCVMIMFWSGLNNRAQSHYLCTSPGA